MCRYLGDDEPQTDRWGRKVFTQRSQTLSWMELGAYLLGEGLNEFSMWDKGYTQFFMIRLMQGFLSVKDLFPFLLYPDSLTCGCGIEC